MGPVFTSHLPAFDLKKKKLESVNSVTNYDSRHKRKKNTVEWEPPFLKSHNKKTIYNETVVT